MNYKIASIAGDGIGPEIVREARKVLDKIGQKYGHTFEYEELLMGGCSIDVYGESLTDETLEKAKPAILSFWELSEEMSVSQTGIRSNQANARKQDY